MMRVRFLGSGTALPTRDRSYASVHVAAAGRNVLLDAGPGTLAKLAKVGVSFHDLHSLWLTHVHPDHCLDLVSILFAMRIPLEARKSPFTIYGPRGIGRLYRQMNAAFSGRIAPRGYKLLLREIDATSIRAPGLTVKSAHMNHSARTLAYRVESGGRSVVYSGDTDMCPEIVGLGKGADLLILECSMPDERKVAGHLTPSECGRIAAEAGCRRLALTHFYPVFKGYPIRERVRRFYKGPVVLAKDFLTVEV